jgi:hypothetical protein
VLARDLILFLDIIRREKEKPEAPLLLKNAFEYGEYKSAVFWPVMTRINMTKSDIGDAVGLVMMIDESVNDYRRRRLYDN